MNLLNDKSLKWKRYTEREDFDYPIDYSDAILDAREDGRLEILVKVNNFEIEESERVYY